MHHGILGMHWGVRRYQNKDGSLTSAGKKRYSDAVKLHDYHKAFADATRAEKDEFNKYAKKKNSGLSKEDIKAWNAGYDSNIKYFDDMASKYSSEKLSSMSRKDLKEAKSLVQKLNKYGLLDATLKGGQVFM